MATSARPTLASPTAAIRALFATPFVTVSMPDAAPLCHELTELFLARENDEHRYRGVRATQRGLFESRFDLFRWPDPPAQRLTAFCHEALSNFVMRLNGYTVEEMERLRFDYEAWFHVTRRGGFQGLHIHPNHTWSGIFCVDPGDPPPTPDSLSGVVRFHDPRLHVTMHEDLGNRRLIPPFTTGGMDIRHEAGQLVLMPSYLHHEIFPYDGERPRLVVAFNCRVGAEAA